MEEALAWELSKKLQIDIEQIVREEYEMILLKKLFESKMGRHLIFKGGTALRLCYGSPRFSQDLNFSLKGAVSKKDFYDIVNSFPREFPQIKIRDLFAKRFTFLAVLRIKEDYFARPFSIKIEISRRKERWQEDKGFQVVVVKSEITPLNFLAQVSTLDKILEDKLDILKRRKEPRDLFDIWFISEKLKKSLKIPLQAFKERELKRELHKFLPKPWWKIIDVWLKKEKVK